MTTATTHDHDDYRQNTKDNKCASLQGLPTAVMVMIEVDFGISTSWR